MAFNLKRSKNQPMSEINVTPFVDVMLVLLVIFMIAAPLLSASLKTSISQAADQTNQTQTFDLKITKEGYLEFNNKQISPADFSRKLAQLKQKKPDIELRLSADPDVAYSDILTTMALAHEQEVMQIQFVKNTTSYQ